MNFCSKDIYLHNIRIKIACNDHSLLERLSSQLQFPKFRKYSNYINVEIKIHVKYSVQEGERSDAFDTTNNIFSLNCWLKNINVKIDKKSNSVYAQILLPNALEEQALLHLIIIEPLRYILKQKGIIFIHSAAMAKNDTGLLIFGGPAAGKSTLAYALLKKGYKFLSDEFTILNKKAAYSFPLKIKLDKLDFKLLKNLRPFGNAENKSFAPKNEFKPEKISESIKPQLALFIFKARSRLKSIGIRRLSREECFMLLISDKNNSLLYEKNPALRKKQIQALSFIAETSKSYCLSYRLDTIDQACQEIDKLI